jgi:peptide subunit release factor 1 (eRF1)
MSVADTARRLLDLRPQHPVVSLYFDLDPEEFATPPARESQVHSLIDGALQDAADDHSLGHADRLAVREDLQWLRDYLLSGDAPFQGARALAVFRSSGDDLSEVIQSAQPVKGRVVIASTPYVEPLLAGAESRRWCAALVSRREVRIFTGTPDRLREREHREDDVHGQHRQGGWSQANYERSVQEEVDAHLRRVAGELHKIWQRDRFDRLALGGPQEIVAQFEGSLHGDLRQRLVEARVAVDVAGANDDQIDSALAELVEEDDRKRERAALDRLAAGLGSGGRAAGGPEATLEALNERRVEVLLLEEGWGPRGGRCPSDGLLTLQMSGPCPADGTELEEIEDLGEAAIEAAVAQDAEVLVVRRYPDLGPHRGIAGLLRF